MTEALRLLQENLDGAQRTAIRLRRSLAKLAPARGFELLPEDLRRLAPAHTSRR